MRRRVWVRAAPGTRPEYLGRVLAQSTSTSGRALRVLGGARDPGAGSPRATWQVGTVIGALKKGGYYDNT